jgi:predicted house-cleaning noncanonical NTP pyrophosphatase (MazG superfamily)
MGKLVRDGIPALIRAGGNTPIVRVLAESDFQSAVFEKLLEEAAELRSAPAGEQLGEAADVYEVLLAAARTMGVTMDEIAMEAERKRLERGGFQERLWLDT